MICGLEFVSMAVLLSLVWWCLFSRADILDAQLAEVPSHFIGDGLAGAAMIV
jgi:hypothetical protein